jgi:Zn-dependent protease
MRGLRALVAWVFFAAASSSALGTASLLVRSHHHASWVHTLPLLRQISFFAYLLAPTVLFGAAWWTTIRERASARVWGLAASGLIAVIGLMPLLFYFWLNRNREILLARWQVNAMVLGAGVVGLVAYGPRFKPRDRATIGQETSPAKGDGTFAPVNRYGVFLAPAATYFIYSWWVGLMRERGLWTGFDLTRDNLAFLIILFAVVVIHELGHALAARTAGMQFTLFALGPLELRRNRCRWKFRFDSKMFLRRAGAVGALSVSARPPRWHGASVAAAGPAVNLVTGAGALLVGLKTSFAWWPMLGGYLVLFGAVSLVYGSANLVPFRVGRLYSDGARFYQSIASNPFCDLVRIQQTAMAVPETVLRPRDYDIEAIERTASLFPGDSQGHYLRLYEHEYYLENSLSEQARKALNEAEAIYERCALKEQTEVTFILGHAFLFRDGDRTRRWWQRLEARQPDRSKSEYWMAKSAFDCIEGRVEEAAAALRQAVVLIQGQPASGSRAFDEDWKCRLDQFVQETAKSEA